MHLDAYHTKIEREQSSLGNPYLEQIIRPLGSSLAADGQNGMDFAPEAHANGVVADSSVLGTESIGDFNDLMWPEIQSGFLVPQMNDDIGFQLFWDGYSPPLLAGMQMQNDDMSVPPWA